MVTITTGRRERIVALDYDYASQPKEAQQTCNLCGASEFVILTHHDRYGYPAQAHACRHCGLVWIHDHEDNDWSPTPRRMADPRKP